MKQINAMNAIRFSFMFHQYTGGKIEGCDPVYILEKWKAHFRGLEPKEISSERREALKTYVVISKWIENWGEASYTVMSRYLSIIIEINISDMVIHVPSRLIGIIEDSVEGFAEADLFEYKGLHTSIEESMQRWMASNPCSQDMIQVNRRIALGKIMTQ